MRTLRKTVLLLPLCLASVNAGEHPPLTQYQVGLDLLSPAVADSVPGAILTPEGRKSPGLAAAASLLVPGVGEWYAGEPGAGKPFIIAEGALWLTYLAFELYGNALRDDARAFATLRAGVAPAGKDDQFYVDVGNFQNVRDYNEKQLRDREPDRLYDPAAGFGWAWGADADRATFRDQRLSAESMFNNRKFVAAAIVVNHIVSAINAARLVISRNAELAESPVSLRAETRLLGASATDPAVMLTLRRTF